MLIFRSRARLARVWISLVLASMLAGYLVTPVSAAPNIVIGASIGACQFGGVGAGSLKTVNIEWRDQDNNLKSKHSVKSTTTGRFTTKCERGEEIEIGDLLSTRVGTGAFYTSAVPDIRASIDRDADSVFVISNAGITVDIDLYTFGGTFDSLVLDTHSGIAVPGYGVHEPFPEADIAGYDFADVSWVNPHGDLFVRTVIAPGFTAWQGRPYMSAQGNAGSMLDVRITDIGNTTTYARTGGVLWEGQNAFYLYNNDGARRNTVAGDRVAVMLGDTAASVIMPNITATISKGQDTVDAYCHSSLVGVEVHVYARDGSLFRYRDGFTGVSSLNEALHANFAVAPKHNIVSGDKVDVYCKFSTGDIVARRFTVP